MRIKVSIYNSMSAMFLQFVNLLVNFVLPIAIITEYGSAINGLVTNIRQLVVYLAIVEGGLAGAAIYALYKPLAEKDRSRVSGILSAANKFYNISGAIFSLLLLGSVILYPLVLGGGEIPPMTIASLVLVIGLSGVLDFFVVGKYKVLLTADQRSYVISLIQAIAVFLNAAIIVVLAKLHMDILVVQTVALVSFFLRSYLYYAYCKRRYDFLDLHTEPETEALSKRWDVLLLNILGIITIAAPSQIVTFMFGLREMSVYGIYNLVFAGVLAILSTFSNGLSASFGDMLARKETGRFRKAYLQYEYLYYILLGWAYSCAALLIMPFITVYVGGYEDANYIRPLLGYLFALNGLLYNLKSPQGMLVISAGLYRETRRPTIIQAVLNLGGSVILAFFLGIPGILLGSIIANLYRMVQLAVFIPRTVTGTPVSTTLRRILRTLLLTLATVSPVLFMDIGASSYFEWFLVAIRAGLWSLLVFVLYNILVERDTAKEVYIRFKTLLEARL